MSSVSGCSVDSAFNESGSFKLTSNEGSASQVLRSERILMWPPRSCFPHSGVMMRMIHPKFITILKDNVEFMSDSYNVQAVRVDVISQTP